MESPEPVKRVSPPKITIIITKPAVIKSQLERVTEELETGETLLKGVLGLITAAREVIGYNSLIKRRVWTL